MSGVTESPRMLSAPVPPPHVVASALWFAWMVTGKSWSRTAKDLLCKDCALWATETDTGAQHRFIPCF